MKESAQEALSLVRSHAAEYGISDDVFKNFDLHIHVFRRNSEGWAFGRDYDDDCDHLVAGEYKSSCRRRDDG